VPATAEPVAVEAAPWPGETGAGDAASTAVEPVVPPAEAYRHVEHVPAEAPLPAADDAAARTPVVLPNADDTADTAPARDEPDPAAAYLVDVGYDTGAIHPPLPTYGEAAPPPPSLPPMPEPLPTYPAPTVPPPGYPMPANPGAAPVPTYPVDPVAETTGPLPVYPPDPGGPADPGDGGRHAATAPPWRRAVTSGALAVGAVVVGLLTANYWHAGGYPGHPVHKAQPGPGPAVVGPAPGTHPSAHPAVPSAAAPTHAPAASRAAAPVATPSPRLAAGTATVTVLNETDIRGLAEKEAARITAAGWHVRRTKDVNARYAVTTVFYERGQEDQARLLLRTVPSVKEMRLRPNIFLPTGGLIVVVASDAA
jgi:hypothetical protein